MRMMKDSGIEWIGEIPEKWGIESIGRHFENRNEKVSDYDYAPLSVTKSGVVPQLDEVAKSNAHEDRKLVRRGDFVINSRSDRKQSCGLSSYDGSVSLINLVLVPHGEIDSLYSSYLFNNYGFAEEFYRWGTGIVADLWSTKWDLMRRINVPVPPIAEQKKIADFLDGKCAEIDELVQTEEKMIEELKAYKQSVITEAVTKGLNPSAPMKDSGIEWIGKIPASWEVKKLKQFCDGALKYGANANGIAYRTDLARYVRITDILDNRLRDDILKQSLPNEIANDYILQDNDILFARSGGTVGKTFIFDASKYGKCAFAGYLIRARISAENIAKYVYYYTLSTCYNEWKNRIFIQSTIQNIGASKYSMLDITAPSLDEQKQIADYLDEECAKIDEIIALRNEQINQLKDYKKSLIYEYVTGKKEVV